MGVNAIVRGVDALGDDSRATKQHRLQLLASGNLYIGVIAGAGRRDVSSVLYLHAGAPRR